MSIPDELRNIRDNLRSGRFGQREVWEQQLEKAAVEIERLTAALLQIANLNGVSTRLDAQKVANRELEHKP